MNAKNDVRRKRRWPWFAAAIVLIGILLGPLAVGAVTSLAGAKTDAASQGEVVTVSLGDLSASVSASGNLAAPREAGLSLDVAGTVKEVLVSVGDAVKAGDALVSLDATALARAVENAKLALAIQQANLDDLVAGSSAAELASAQAAVDSARANLDNVKNGANANDIASARASLASAQAAYDALLAGPDKDSVAQALANLKNAEAAVKKAQAAYDRVAGSPDIGMRAESLELEKATNDYAAAKAAYASATKGPTSDEITQAKATVEQAKAALQKLLDGPTAAEVAAAESQLAQAQATLDSANSGASDAKIAVAQAQVEQAQLSLAEAQDNLAKATLTAPFDGVITAVHVAEGEQASGLAIEMADTSSLDLVLDVDEVDMGSLAVGQAATVTFETWPGEEVQGVITSIAPKATAGNSAIVSYAVRVKLDTTSLPVRIGMSADAALVTGERKNVLLVPSAAITADRAAGTYTVNVVRTGADGSQSVTKTAVTVGLKDGENTEITSGLSEGQKVLVGEITTAAATGSGLLPGTSTASSGNGALGR